LPGDDEPGRKISAEHGTGGGPAPPGVSDDAPILFDDR
jgi:hypothetical protein